MAMEKTKMLPYGIASFEDLRRQGFYYADKTMYIPRMEDAGNFLFLIRPRRFGKSVFLSMLRCYYDVAMQDRFDMLFDGLWIKEHPTELRGRYQVMYFDFSQVSSDPGDLKGEFHKYCSGKLISFADTYASFYREGFLEEVRRKSPDSSDQLRYICDEAKKLGHELYLIIDEYDNFTNNVLNEQGQAVYHALTHATGFYRDVFKIYKANFQRILMMGVSPVTLDDLTSGFNISRNISTDPRFNMMLGFSETEVRRMIDYYRGAGLIKAETDALIEEMRPWYGNYCFSEKRCGVDPPVYNCAMVLYSLRAWIDFGQSPEQMPDVNACTSYSKLVRLLQLDGMTDRERGLIRRIAAEGSILSNVNNAIPADCIFDRENFISLLYHYGLLTITGVDLGYLILGIPNNSVRQQYYRYLLFDYHQQARIDTMDLEDAFDLMAKQGDCRPALQLIADGYRELSSVRSGMEGERNLQGFLMAYLNLSPLYLTAPEVELNHGYCDLFLMPDLVRYPAIRHSYIIELKVLKTSDSDERACRQWAEAADQVHGYAQGPKVRLMTAGTDLHCIVLQMRGTELYRLEEV